MNNEGRARDRQSGKPIETAPRDGTEVLAYKPRLKSWLPVRWLDADHPDYEGEFFHHAWDYTPMEGLTHWVPMPPPPNTAPPAVPEQDAIDAERAEDLGDAAARPRPLSPSDPSPSVSAFGSVPIAAGEAQSVWPTARDVMRPEDMGQTQLRVMLDGDNDVIVDLWEPGKRSVSAEFCNPGACGGGRSRKTRMALIALMKAIEEDNASNPIAKDAA